MIYPQMLLDLNKEIIVDLFAGGGGASCGIEMALGRMVDVAVNHDPAAVAMHRINHPQTIHYRADVFEVDPREVTGGRPVGLLWASPDCTYHSKARGAKPIRHKNRKRRALAWVVTRWAGQVRPRVIMLENVEEFAEWGPLVGPPDALRPCPKRRGRTFRKWVRSLERLGYRVEWRERRACDAGAPTIRKRLYLIARCDGRPIVWPEPTHGPRGSGLLPYRTAAECIDWSIPMLSIFATREEAKAWGRAHGQAAPKRPLADATMRRVARGVMRYVVENPEPYIVGVGGRAGQSPPRSLRVPYQTITAKGDAALVAPVIASIAHGDSGGRREYPPEDPLGTLTSAGVQHALVAPYLVPRYGEREGQEPRTRSVQQPAPVIVPTGNGGSLAAVHLSPYHAEKRPGEARGSMPDEPIGTLDTSNRHAVVAGFLAKHFTGVDGVDLRHPAPTVTTIDHNGLVAAHLATLRGTSSDADVAEPLHTVSAGGTHHGIVASFLQSYYGTGNQQSPDDPLFTIPTHDRFGLVTVQVRGEPYILADIAMRMLQPGELYRAQGFPRGYVYDRGIDEEGRVVRFTKTEQVRMCGNSVSPYESCALAGSNLPELIVRDEVIASVKRQRRARKAAACA